MTKRLFAAVKVSPSAELSDVFRMFQTELAQEKIRWVDISNIHITLKFFGDTPVEQIPRITTCFEDVAKSFSHFNIQIENCGVFPNLQNPNVLWLGISRSAQLLQLQSEINTSLKALGWEAENRTFKPHLTLGRISYILNNEILKTLIKEYEKVHFQENLIKDFHLYESRLTPKGSIYSIIKSFRLK